MLEKQKRIQEAEKALNVACPWKLAAGYCQELGNKLIVAQENGPVLDSPNLATACGE